VSRAAAEIRPGAGALYTRTLCVLGTDDSDDCGVDAVTVSTSVAETLCSAGALRRRTLCSPGSDDTGA